MPRFDEGMRREHCDFAESEAMFVGSDYSVETTTMREWWFCFDPQQGLLELAFGRYRVTIQRCYATSNNQLLFRYGRPSNDSEVIVARQRLHLRHRSLHRLRPLFQESMHLRRCFSELSPAPVGISFGSIRLGFGLREQPRSNLKE